MTDPRKPGPADAALESLLSESRTFDPPPAFRARAHVRDESPWQEADRDLEAFWARQAGELEWITPWSRVLEWSPPDAKWFLGGRLNVSRELHRPSRAHLAAQQGRPHLGGRDRRPPHDDLLGPPSRGQPFRQRPQVARRGQGRPRRDLPSPDPRGGGRDAGVRAHRRDPHGRLRRVLVRVPAGPDQRRRGQGSHHGRRRLPPRRVPAPQARRRVRGARVRFRSSTSSWSSGGGFPDPHEAGARPLVPRARRRGRVLVRARADGLGGSRSTSSTRPARRGSPRGSCTRRAATSRGSTRRRSGSSTCARTTSTGARRTWAGSRATRYVVYGPLACGATVVMYEGAPDWPDKGRFWEIVARLGVTVFYTAPTAIRAFMKWGPEWPGSTTSPRCACSARWASRSTPRRGSGTTSTSAASAAPSSTRGGRRRRG